MKLESFSALITIVVKLLFIRLVRTSDTLDDSWKYVEKMCNQKLFQINSIVEFEKFIEHFRVVMQNETKPKRGILNLDKNIRTCFEAKDRLFALDELVKTRESGVCQLKFIDKLIDYHINYLPKRGKGNDQNINSSRFEEAAEASWLRRSFDAHFFSLFVHQVALTCKSKLNERVRDLQSSHDCSSVISHFLPVSNYDNDPEIKTIAEKFIQQFTRVEDYAPLPKQSDCDEPYFEVIISSEAKDRIDQLKALCREREPHYKALFSPVALLAQLGYDIDDELLSSRDLVDQKRMSCWLATAQLCQGVLRTHISTDHKSINGSFYEDDQKLVEVKFGKRPDDLEDQAKADLAGEVYVDSVDEISPDIVDLVKRKRTIKSKLKRRALIWAKGIIERHVNFEAKRKEMIEKFIEELTRDNRNAMDTPVAFSGTKSNHGMYLPARMISDDADTIVQATSFFAHKVVAVAISSVVAISLSVVFILLSVYSAITSLRNLIKSSDDVNFKEHWRSSYNTKVQKMNDKVHKKGWINWKEKMKVYTGE